MNEQTGALLALLLPFIGAGIAAIARRYLHGRAEDRRIEAEADERQMAVALMPLAHYEKLIEAQARRIERLEAKLEHLEEERAEDAETVRALEREMRQGQERADRQIAALRRGINLLIGQITEAGLKPVWHPEDDDSERSDKT